MFANKPPNSIPASPPIISPLMNPPPEKNPRFVFVVAADLLVVLVSAFLCWKVLLFVLLLLLLKLFEPDLYDFASTVVELS